MFCLGSEANSSIWYEKCWVLRSFYAEGFRFGLSLSLRLEIYLLVSSETLQSLQETASYIDRTLMLDSVTTSDDARKPHLRDHRCLGLFLMILLLPKRPFFVPGSCDQPATWAF